jgi:hypothetical protein
MSMRFDPSESFEEVYPRVHFSELIRLSILLAGAFRKLADRAQRQRDRFAEAAPPRQINLP